MRKGNGVIEKEKEGRSWDSVRKKEETERVENEKKGVGRK